jgi:pimeloyl-ACP methyl ester carboxylesterase
MRPVLCFMTLLTASLSVKVYAQPGGFKLPPALQQQIAQEIEMQTLGGRQFWGDVQFAQDWHIQRNVFTGHYRLLDGRDWRHTWGTLADCQAKLKELQQSGKILPMSGPGVILLHGIIRSSKSIYRLGDELKAGGFTPFCFDYPSTQITIEEAAESLHNVIEQLDGIEELHLVGHSMGGLVIRAYFAKHRDPRIRRVVMLGTPNQGAELADLLKQNLLYRTVFGPAGRQLVTEPEGTIPTLPVPPVEFAVIAGARGNDSGWNPLVPGDDDGTVAVARTKLGGAVDFGTAPVLHHALLSSPTVARQVRRFLLEGQLRETGPKQPIPIDSE